MAWYSAFYDRLSERLPNSVAIMIFSPSTHIPYWTSGWDPAYPVAEIEELFTEDSDYADAATIIATNIMTEVERKSFGEQ